MKLSARSIHRLVGTVCAVFLASSAVTGLLWAYAPYLYWRGGYLEKKNPAPAPPLDAVQVPVREALARAGQALGPDAVIVSVILRADIGRLLYEVEYRRRGSHGALLVDGLTGAVLSPLSEAQAIAVARQYVRDTPPVEDVERLNDFTPRTGGGAVPVWRVRFRQAGAPEVFVHRESGRAIEELDRVRRFHVFVMQLHQLNFFGFRKTLTLLPGLALLVMIATGLFLWLAPRLRRAQFWSRSAARPRPEHR